MQRWFCLSSWKPCASPDSNMLGWNYKLSPNVVLWSCQQFLTSFNVTLGHLPGSNPSHKMKACDILAWKLLNWNIKKKNTISLRPFFSFSGISRESGDGALRGVRWSVDMKPRYLTAKPIKFLEMILNIGFNLFLVTRYAEPCSQDNLTVPDNWQYICQWPQIIR